MKLLVMMFALLMTSFTFASVCEFYDEGGLLLGRVSNGEIQENASVADQRYPGFIPDYKTVAKILASGEIQKKVNDQEMDAYLTIGRILDNGHIQENISVTRQRYPGIIPDYRNIARVLENGEIHKRLSVINHYSGLLRVLDNGQIESQYNFFVGYVPIGHINDISSCNSLELNVGMLIFFSDLYTLDN